MLKDLNQITDMVVIENEKNYLTSYKEHMLKVQVELIHLKRKTSEQYNSWKKDQRLKFLEGSICWLRDEALKLATSLEELKETNAQLKREMDVLATENMYMKEYTHCTKRQNMKLEKTIVQLKDPENLRKYAAAQAEIDKLNLTIPNIQNINTAEMPFTPPDQVMIKTQ